MAARGTEGCPTGAAKGPGVELLARGQEETQRTGPVSSVHEAELLVPADAEPLLLTTSFMERVAWAYRGFLGRVSFGLLRTRTEPGFEALVLLVPWPPLLRFHAPSYRADSDWAEVAWDIDRGLLVAREGRGRGSLRIRIQQIARDGEEAGRARFLMRMEVDGYYPRCRGGGWFTPVGTWLYAQTQARIHRLVMRGFMRSLARFEPVTARDRRAGPRQARRFVSVARRALVTGATGFVGGRLASALADRGWEVRCLVRDRSRARELADRGFELHEADVLDPEALRGAGRGVEAAYYLIHSMGRGAVGDFEERERQGARNFARMAKREGVGRVVYLGGLGDRPQSKHLRSRRRTARILAELGPPLTYFRAGMIVGAGSESYRTLRYLVQRLPAMIGPAWLAKPTQPIGIDDVVAYLAAAPDVAGSEGREIQIGGPDVLSYGEMLDLMADALGVRRRPRIPVPLITPWLSSLWIGLVTPVDPGVARPLVEGLSTPTVVTDSSGAELFDVRPIPFMDALRRALAEDPEMHVAPGS